MKPTEWLELIRKDLLSPEDTTEEELATLRSNYVIWREGANFVKDQEFENHRQILKKALGYRTFPDEEYHALVRGEKTDSVSDEAFVVLQEEFARHYVSIGAIHERIHQIKFFQKFDEQIKTETGEAPHEVQEAVWKLKAEALTKAIEEHRRAHVLANKEPNGLDFQLWATIDLEEFHPSRHRQISTLGYIPDTH